MIYYRYGALAAGLVALSCTDTPQQPSAPPSSAVAATPAVLVGAGDIAGCPSNYKDEATAKLLDGIPGTVFTLGDNVYPNGTASEFKNCYGPSWGRHRSRTRPSVGNHEYYSGGDGYFGYFGTRARPAGRSYYSYNLGEWHIVVLDSERYFDNQAIWLKADLAANPRRCTLAYWHKPYYTTGDLPPSTNLLKRLVAILYNAGADVVVAGHNHIYERFAPQDPAGRADPTRGIRAFVVGTGGAPLLSMRAKTSNLQVRQNTTHGVLKLSLYPKSYKWEFIPVAGKTFKDSGSNSCH